MSLVTKIEGYKTKIVAAIQGVSGLLVFFGIDPVGLEDQVGNLVGALLMLLAVKDYLLRMVTTGPAAKIKELLGK